MAKAKPPKRNPSCIKPKYGPPSPPPKPPPPPKKGAVEKLGDKLFPGFAKVKKTLK